MENPPSRWTSYYENTQGLPPHESLVQALELVTNREAVLDVGAGALRDTKHLLNANFQIVVALDAEEINEDGAIADSRLEVVTEAFETYEFPANTFDIVNAQFSLPFTAPDSFESVFKKVLGSLKVGGVFVGQLFGKNDSWSDNPKMTFHSTLDVERLLSGMEILGLEETEYDGTTATGNGKHWHIFHITARKLA
jgi:tellurite methyltransferase